MLSVFWILCSVSRLLVESRAKPEFTLFLTSRDKWTQWTSGVKRVPFQDGQRHLGMCQMKWFSSICIKIALWKRCDLGRGCDMGSERNVSPRAVDLSWAITLPGWEVWFESLLHRMRTGTRPRRGWWLLPKPIRKLRYKFHSWSFEIELCGEQRLLVFCDVSLIDTLVFRFLESNQRPRRFTGSLESTADLTRLPVEREFFNSCDWAELESREQLQLGYNCIHLLYSNG